MRTKIGEITAAVVQRVGNKSMGDGISFSSDLCPMEAVEGHLHKLIEKSFNYDDLKRFDAIDSLEYNNVYRFVSKIFDDEGAIIEQSHNLARHLYEQSIHPYIKSGEFYIVYFKNCEIEGAMVDAVGLFKSEKQETILKVLIDNNMLRLQPEQGMSLKKLDKGCIVFNIDRENGFKVAVVDNTNTGKEAHYWVDDFLNVVNCGDNYHQTQQIAEMCTGFLKQIQNEENEMECAVIAKKATELLSSEEPVGLSDFSELLCQTEEQKDQFEAYKSDFESANGFLPEEDFIPVATAFKRKSVSKMNKWKVGNQFEIKILNPDVEIEKGIDEESGKQYLKLYYTTE